MKTYSYYVLFLLVVFCGCSRPTELTSPDGNIKSELSTLGLRN